MIRLFTHLLIGLALAGSAHAAPKWARITGAVAMCAASGLDAYTTYQGGQVGAREMNPLLRNAQGGPSTWKLVSFKAATCGLAVWSARKEKRSNVRLAGNLAGAAVFGVFAQRNMALRDKLLAERVR